MKSLYNQILSDQREELDRLNSEKLIPREALIDFPATSNLIRIISGVRRCGKSTLALLHLRDRSFAYINFDDERLLHLRADQLNDVLESAYNVYGKFNCLFLDEIQNIEGWHLFVNRLQRQEIEIYITGSNSKLLSRELATHLTGRFIQIELFPFSFIEYLRVKRIDPGLKTTQNLGSLNSAFEEFILNGGFPEIVLGADGKRYISDLFHAIINRDILYRYELRNSRALREMALYLISQFGREISYNRLKNIFQLGSDHTARNYVDYLEETYLISTLSKFSFKKQESVRYRKLYVIDQAFIAALSHGATSDRGHLLENIVYIHLLSQSHYTGRELYYYKNGVEVDFLVRENSQVTSLIQVCSDLRNEQTLKREIRSLVQVSGLVQCKNLLLINETRTGLETVDGVEIQYIKITDWLIGNFS